MFHLTGQQEERRIVGRTLRAHELTAMYAAVLNRDYGFLERASFLGQEHRRIFDELYEAPPRADFVFHASIRSRIILDRYSADEVIIPGLERAWSDIQSAGIAARILGVDAPQAEQETFNILKKAFRGSAIEPPLSQRYPSSSKDEETPEAQLFRGLVFSIMQAISVQERDPKPIRPDDFEIVHSYVLHRIEQRQFDHLMGIHDKAVETQKMVAASTKRSDELKRAISRLVA